MEVSKLLQQRYAEQARKCDPQFLLQALDINNQCDLNYRASNNKRLHLEITLLQLCALSGGGLPAAKQEIRPAQPKAASTKAAPANTPSSKPAAAPPNPASTSSKPAYTSPPSRPAETPNQVHEAPPRSKSVRTVSINDDDTESQEKPKEPEPETRGEFTQDMLVEAWKDFVESYKETSPSFSMAIGRYEPELKSDHEINFTIDNSLVANDKLNMNALYDHLKKRFNNNQIKLKPIVAEKPQSAGAYTDREKFNQMVIHRPHLMQLKQELNLETEF
jgi:DNA polymerase-3 subunit gamma/tau